MTRVGFVPGNTATTNPPTLTPLRCSTECCTITNNNCYRAYNKNGELVNKPSEPVNIAILFILKK